MIYELPPTMTASTTTAAEVLAVRLSAISKSIRGRQADVRALERQRTELVRQALADGWTHAQIAEATGLTRGRIGQLARPT